MYVSYFSNVTIVTFNICQHALLKFNLHNINIKTKARDRCKGSITDRSQCSS